MPFLLFAGSLVAIALYRRHGRRPPRRPTNHPRHAPEAGGGLVSWSSECRSRRADEEARRQRGLSSGA